MELGHLLLHRETLPTAKASTMTTPTAIYVWLVPSEHVQEQPGSWRIRKWDIEPFPEANFECRQMVKRPDPLSQALNEGDGSYKP